MTAETFLNGKVTLLAGDSRDVLKTIPDCSIDSIVTDPPYALVSIVKRFGGKNAAGVKVPEGGSGAYARASSGFMGKQWDTGETAFAVEFWAECLRVLKPGGHVVAFSGTRTYHRMACAIEDAGFEIRDMLSYLYGSGFPKSHSVDRGLGDARCKCGDDPVRGLRAGSENADGVVQAGESADMLTPMQRGIAGEGMGYSRSQGISGTQDFHSDVRAEKSGMERRGNISKAARKLRTSEVRSMPSGPDLNGAEGRLRDGASPSDGSQDWSGADADGMRAPLGSQAAAQRSEQPGAMAGQPISQAGGAWENCGRCGKPMVPSGIGTALKPACEPIVMARKPLIGTVAQNVLQYGTGAINIEGCRVETDPNVDDARLGGNGAWRTDKAAKNVYSGGYAGDDIASSPKGRWPANVLHDGGDEVVAAFPESDSRSGSGSGSGSGGIWSPSTGKPAGPTYGDGNGSAARFFYTAKADAMDRVGSKHPTVKPVDLMQWLCRLVTPPGGTVLDPFSGTGTTGEAAFREGFNAILIEREPEYQTDIRRRMGLVLSGPDERARESTKARTAGQPIDAGPLFGGLDTPPPAGKYQGHKSKFYVGPPAEQSDRPD